jgi:ABC-type sugar transport system ATPase subunit
MVAPGAATTPCDARAPTTERRPTTDTHVSRVLGRREVVGRAVARAAFWAERAMLMDEPTAALGVRESTQVLKLARSVADRGLAVVLISHILPHVMELADRIFVMRHGRCVAELTEDISSERLVRLIVGVDAEDVVAAPEGGTAPE